MNRRVRKHTDVPIRLIKSHWTTLRCLLLACTGRSRKTSSSVLCLVILTYVFWRRYKLYPHRYIYTAPEKGCFTNRDLYRDTNTSALKLKRALTTGSPIYRSQLVLASVLPLWQIDLCQIHHVWNIIVSFLGKLMTSAILTHWWMDEGRKVPRPSAK